MIYMYIVIKKLHTEQGILVSIHCMHHLLPNLKVFLSPVLHSGTPNPIMYVLLNVVDPGCNVLDVVGGHKLGVATGHEDASG